MPSTRTLSRPVCAHRPNARREYRRSRLSDQNEDLFVLIGQTTNCRLGSMYMKRNNMVADELTNLHPRVVSAVRVWEEELRVEIEKAFTSSVEGLSDEIRAALQPFFNVLTAAIPEH